MDIPDEILDLLWLVAGAIVVWRLLPAVLNALGLTLRHGHVDNDVVALLPAAGNDPEYTDLFGQLRSLGFHPVGTRTNTYWFFVHHWYRKFRARVFALADDDCYAVAYKLRIWDNWRLCFVTAFSDGAILETANQMESLRIEEPKFLRWGLATPDRALLLERHRQACREFAGGRTVAALPFNQVNRLILQHDVRNHRKRHRWTGLNVVSASIFVLGIGLALLQFFAGPDVDLVPVGVIAWAMLWPAIHAVLFRLEAESSRAEDARRQARQGAPRSLSRGAV
jgi:hypothetical protein